MTMNRTALPRTSGRLHSAACKAAFALCCVILPHLATAQAVWPERSLQLVVPFPAGGAVDVVARAFAERFGELLGRPVVIVNRDGASGTIGVAQVAAARADGYTLGFVTHGPLVIQPHLMKDLPYKPDGLVPICQAFAGQYVLAVAPKSPLNSLDDLLAAAKARPGKLSYGFGGVGTTPHLVMSQLANLAGIDLLAVPFRGDPAAIVALRGGEIDVAPVNLGLARAQGLRVLATFADERQPAFASAPTLREGGWNLAGSVYGGLVAPRGVAPEIVRQAENACEKAVADERFRTIMRNAAQEAVYRDAAAFARTLARDLENNRDAVRAARIPAN